MKRLITVMGLVAVVMTLSAAAITHTILTSYQSTGGNLTGAASVTSDAEHNADVTLVGGTSNQLLSVSLNVSNCQAMCLFSTAVCTVQLYNGAVLWNTVVLTNNSPVTAVGSNSVLLVLKTNVITSLRLWPGTNSQTFSLRSVSHDGP